MSAVGFETALIHRNKPSPGATSNLRNVPQCLCCTCTLTVVQPPAAVSAIVFAMQPLKCRSDQSKEICTYTHVQSFIVSVSSVRISSNKYATQEKSQLPRSGSGIKYRRVQPHLVASPASGGRHIMIPSCRKIHPFQKSSFFLKYSSMHLLASSFLES